MESSVLLQKHHAVQPLAQQVFRTYSHPGIYPAHYNLTTAVQLDILEEPQDGHECIPLTNLYTGAFDCPLFSPGVRFPAKIIRGATSTIPMQICSNMRTGLSFTTGRITSFCSR